VIRQQLQRNHFTYRKQRIARRRQFDDVIGQFRNGPIAFGRDSDDDTLASFDLLDIGEGLFV
jgi:hypothetical protein